MPVSLQTPSITYQTDGLVGSFGFPFKVQKASDLKVFVNEIETTGYTIDGLENEAGGSITFASMPAPGTVRLSREIPLTRTTDYQEGGALRAQVLDNDLDRVVMIAQDLSRDIDAMETTIATYLGSVDADLQLMKDRLEAAGVSLDTVIDPRLFDSVTKARLLIAEQSAELYKRMTSDLDDLSDAVMKALLAVQQTKEILRDAGITVDPQSGAVKIYAIDQNAEDIRNVSIDLDATKAAVTTKASVDYVNGQIAAAGLTQAGQVAFDSLDVRLTSAETTVSGLTASVNSKASAATVANHEARITTAESGISALNGTITNKVDSSSFNSLTSRVTTAENQLTALDNNSAYVTTLRAGLYKAEADLNADGEATLQSIVDGWKKQTDNEVALAYLKQDLHAKIDENGSAEAAARIDLATKVGANIAAVSDLTKIVSDANSATASQLVTLSSAVDDVEAAISNEQTTRATADTAIASDVTALTTRVGAAETAITNVQTAQTNTDSALATTTTTLSASIANKSKNFAGPTAPVSGMSAGDLWIDSDNNQMFRYTGSAWVDASDNRFTTINATITANATVAANATSAVASDVSALTTRMGSAETAITNEQTARQTADTALTNSLTSLTSRVGTAETNITNNYNTLTASDTSIANSVTSLSTTVGNNYTTVTGQTSALSTRAGALEAQYTVKVDSNGYVSGFGLASTTVNATPYSTFTINADKFKISSPTISGSTPFSPFTVYTTSGTSNGKSYGPGVYMDAAYVKNGTITNAHIGGDLQSSNFVSGTSGWKIAQDGTAEFGNGTFRGNVTATTFNGTNVIGTAAIVAGAITGALTYETASDLTVSGSGWTQQYWINTMFDVSNGLALLLVGGDLSISNPSGSTTAGGIIELMVNNVRTRSYTFSVAPNGSSSRVIAWHDLVQSAPGNIPVQVRITKTAGTLLTCTLAAGATLFGLNLKR